MDIGGSLVLLVLTSPVLVLAALAIRATMGRPVFQRERRAGRGGHAFELLEFRTMDPRPCPNWPDALRVTSVGRLLRVTRMSQLPQLLNVLLGDMSLVGPRPLRLEDVDRAAPGQRRRYEVRPGITGLERVSGGHGLTWAERRELDAWYVDHMSPGLDLRILWRSLLTAVRALDTYDVDPMGDRTALHGGAHRSQRA
jgi:lipopolysaccharide/colanic/teichoic acid biosynthesis glycosyltransferase